jgi:hypothetical protein
MCVLCIVFILFQNGEDTEALGDRAFSQGSYEQALGHYYRAYDTPMVFVKRARILSVLRAEGLVCEYDAYISVILEYVSWALAQDSSLLCVVVDDTLFHEVSRTVLYNIWRGCRTDSDSALMDLISNTTWYEHPLSITAIGGQMVFHDDSTVCVIGGTFCAYDEDNDEFTKFPGGIHTGHCSVENGEIVILWDNGATSVYTLILDYTLGILVDKATRQSIYFDHPDECNT